MAALENYRHERFAQGLARGLPASKAYVEAGYLPSDPAASRLSRNVKVQARAAELVDVGAQRAEVTVERVLTELARIGFSDMRKLVKWTGNAPTMDLQEAEETGEVEIGGVNVVQLFASDQLDDDIAACISEISTTKEGVLKVKLHDKQAALVSMGRHLGMFKDVVDHQSSDGSMTPSVSHFWQVNVGSDT